MLSAREPELLTLAAIRKVKREPRQAKETKRPVRVLMESGDGSLIEDVQAPS